MDLPVFSKNLFHSKCNKIELDLEVLRGKFIPYWKYVGPISEDESFTYFEK